MTVPSAQGPPLRPSGDEAAAWLREELSKPAYRDERSLLVRLVDWFSDLLDQVGAPEVMSTPWVGLALVAVVAAATLVGLGRLARRGPLRLSGRRGAGVLGEELLSASAHRERARSARAQGSYERALLESFRALTVQAMDRTLLPRSPGLTADEVAAALSLRLPDTARDLDRAAADFDAVRYGGRRADEAAARRMADLDERLVAMAPRLPVAPS